VHCNWKNTIQIIGGIAMTESQSTTVSTADATTASDSASNQNFALGFAGGLLAAMCGAALWAVITVATKFQIGWMAVGVGFLVGFAVRRFGGGSSIAYGILGGTLALVGCLAGNLLSTIGFIAQQDSEPFLQILLRLKLSAIPQLLVETFDAMDILFYGIAIYEGFKLSMRPSESAG
jgi:hypothetical protein